MIRLYLCDIQGFLCLNGIDMVTDERRRRIHAFAHAHDKARCLVSGLLLREVCGVKDDSQIVYGEHGKPCLKNSDLHFSLSHSGDYVVLATAGREIGVDIEKLGNYPDAVAVRCFTPTEQSWMRQEECDERFYRLWTAKESVMKASGLGFSLPPEAFCVLSMDSAVHGVAGTSWFLEWLPWNGHMICHAIADRPEKAERTIITAKELT